MNDPELSNLVLVGGTALSLQLGHRISIDLDLFSNIPFDEEELAAYLQTKYDLQLDFISKRTIKGEIQGIKVDCITHQYPWIFPLNTFDGIRLASLPDIAAMKLNAISGNGTRIKDFIDVAYLSCFISFTDMVGFYHKKYNASPVIAVKSIVFFSDINYNEPIKLVGDRKYDWKRVEKRLLNMQRNPDKVFDSMP